MTKTNRKALTVVGDICLYGTGQTGAGYLAQTSTGLLYGTGRPVQYRTFSEAIWHAQDALRQAGGDGLVRIFDSGGKRMAVVGLNEACIYGGLTWKPAPVYTISAEALQAASEAK